VGIAGGSLISGPGIITMDRTQALDGFIVHELDAAVWVRVVRPMPELDTALDAIVEA